MEKAWSKIILCEILYTSSLIAVQICEKVNGKQVVNACVLTPAPRKKGANTLLPFLAEKQ